MKEQPILPKIENIYLPWSARISRITDENSMVKTYHLELQGDHAHDFSFIPGQFVMVSVPDHGEAPISISAGPVIAEDREDNVTQGSKGLMELTIRRAGRLTNAIHQMEVGETVGIRGPYGRPFPMKELKGKDVVIVVGGIGLAPLRPVINYCLASSQDYGRIYLLYGAKSPDELIFKKEIERWSGLLGDRCLLTVDKANEGWTGHVGLVTTLLDKVDVDPDNTICLMCGPPIMNKFVAKGLRDMGIQDQNIITTLERHMKCGVGLCGHCYLGDKFVCKDGPIFDYSQLKEIGKTLRLTELY